MPIFTRVLREVQILEDNVVVTQETCNHEVQIELKDPRPASSGETWIPRSTRRSELYVILHPSYGDYEYESVAPPDLNGT